MLVPAQASVLGGWRLSRIRPCLAVFFADKIILIASNLRPISIVFMLFCHVLPGLWPENASNMLRNSEKKHLELGAGATWVLSAGALLPFFQEFGGDLAKVTGVDLSAGMLSFARQRPLAKDGERIGDEMNGCFSSSWS